MTQKIFWQDPYQTSCSAKVTAIHEKSVKLDQTIFYAFSGGQESDHGTVGGIKVLAAKKQGDKEDIVDIEYTLETEPSFTVGDTVEVTIDPQRRDKLRRLHSTAHILFYKVQEILGEIEITGSHIAADKAKMDFGFEESINDEQLQKIQEAVNTFIQEDHAIVMKGDEQKPDLRWWTCEQWKMPCGGTHVKSTGEIGPLTLKKKNKGKGRKRIEFFLN